MVTPFLVFRGLGKWFNPLALEARDSRFKSGVPDQFFDNLRKLRAGVVYRVCPRPPTQRRDFDYLRPLQQFRGCGSLVERWIASPANGVRFSALAPAGVVQWEERGARNAQTAVRIRASAPAGAAQWQSSRMVGGRPGVRFPALAPSVPPGKHARRCAGFVNRISQFDSGTRLHSGKALRTSNRPITDREMVRFHLPEPSLMKFHCRVDWRRFQLGLISQRRAFESHLRNHPQAWASRSTGGLLACTQ